MDGRGLGFLKYWNVYAGGTEVPDTVNSYDFVLAQPKVQYTISPVGRGGRLAGYVLTVFPSLRMGHAWILPTGEEISVPSKPVYRNPKAAIQAAVAHYNARFVASGEEISPKLAGKKPQEASPKRASSKMSAAFLKRALSSIQEEQALLEEEDAALEAEVTARQVGFRMSQTRLAKASRR